MLTLLVAAVDQIRELAPLASPLVDVLRLGARSPPPALLPGVLMVPLSPTSDARLLASAFMGLAAYTGRNGPMSQGGRVQMSGSLCIIRMVSESTSAYMRLGCTTV
jgi:hypothetical protein